MKRVFVVGLLAGWLVACGGTPEPAPTATVPPAPPIETATPSPTAVAEEPTAEPTVEEPTAEPTAEPTEEAPSPTPLPTEEPTAVPEAPAEAVWAITTPTDEEITGGQTVEVAGTHPLGQTGDLLVSVQVGPHTLVSETVTLDPESTSWQTALAVPARVAGPGRIAATLVEGGEAAVQTITLLSDENAGAGITLTRPQVGDVAVAGTPLFLAGRITNPIDNEMGIGVLLNDCTEFVARQPFSVTSGGGWNGVVYLPSDMTGPGCVVVYTGEYGEGEWRELQQPIEVLDPEDERAPRLRLEVGEGRSWARGEEAVIYGVALAPPDGEVLVSLRDPEDDAVLVEATAVVDFAGYWEVPLTVPDDAPASITVTAVFEEDDQTYRVDVSASTR